MRNKQTIKKERNNLWEILSDNHKSKKLERIKRELLLKA